MSCLAWLSPAIGKEGELGTVCGPQQPRQHLLFEQCLTSGSHHMSDQKWMTASGVFFSSPLAVLWGDTDQFYWLCQFLFNISRDSSPTLQLWQKAGMDCCCRCSTTAQGSETAWRNCINCLKGEQSRRRKRRKMKRLVLSFVSNV